MGGEPYNAEPDKCSELLWVNELPPDTIGYPAAGIRRSVDGTVFSLYGWQDAPGTRTAVGSRPGANRDQAA
jgi:hypothetical protein